MARHTVHALLGGRLNLRFTSVFVFRATGNVKRPKNLQVFSDEQSDNVILTWEQIEGVENFMVQVRILSQRVDLALEI